MALAVQTGWEVARRRPAADLMPNEGCYALIKGFEGFEARAYPDPASPRGKQLQLKLADRVPGWEKLSPLPWTIGYGFTDGVKEGDTITHSEALERLKAEVNIRARIVRDALVDASGRDVAVTQGEFNALVSIVYNLKTQKIPPTMLAYLRGGLTDKGVEVGPRDYSGAMYQFPRSCRAGGMPIRGLYRRRLAESCEFSGLPWGSACSENLVQLEFDRKGVIDWDKTTTLEDTLNRARMDVPLQRPKVDLSKPFPTPEMLPENTTLIVDKLPDSTPVSDDDIFEQVGGDTLAQSGASADAKAEVEAARPAAPATEPVPSAVVADELPLDLTPLPARVESSKAGEAAGPVATQAPPLPSPLPAPIGNKPLSPNTKAPEAVPYGVDPRAGSKPMKETERYQGAKFEDIGSIIIRFCGLGWLGNGAQTVAKGILSDQVLMALLLTTGALIAAQGIGFVVAKYGEWRRKNGERDAVQLMH